MSSLEELLLEKSKCLNSLQEIERKISETPELIEKGITHLLKYWNLAAQEANLRKYLVSYQENFKAEKSDYRPELNSERVFKFKSESKPDFNILSINFTLHGGHNSWEWEIKSNGCNIGDVKTFDYSDSYFNQILKTIKEKVSSDEVGWDLISQMMNFNYC